MCPIQGAVFIPISAEEKKCIYHRWSNALIVKIYGKAVGYRFLCKKLMEIWKPTDTLQIVDLGLDYFLIKLFKSTTLH